MHSLGTAKKHMAEVPHFSIEPAHDTQSHQPSATEALAARVSGTHQGKLHAVGTVSSPGKKQKLTLQSLPEDMTRLWVCVERACFWNRELYGLPVKAKVKATREGRGSR